MSGLLFSSYGFYGAYAEGYQYIQLERSLEYQMVLKRDLRLVDEMEKNFSGFAVVAPPVTAQILAMPELGYVRRGFSVSIYQLSSAHLGIANYMGRPSVNPEKTVWLSNHDRYDRTLAESFPYPVGPFDQVRSRVEFGPLKTTIFQGGYSIDQMLLMHIRAYQEREQERRQHLKNSGRR